jgi:hypothetical protein
LDEYKGKHKLDLVFVYGVESKALRQAPGGRDNAFMVSKATFEALAIPRKEDGNYFLRPDRILGAFYLDAGTFSSSSSSSVNDMDSNKVVGSLLQREKDFDETTKNTLCEVQNEITRFSVSLKKRKTTTTAASTTTTTTATTTTANYIRSNGPMQMKDDKEKNMTTTTPHPTTGAAHLFNYPQQRVHHQQEEEEEEEEVNYLANKMIDKEENNEDDESTMI